MCHLPKIKVSEAISRHSKIVLFVNDNPGIFHPNRGLLTDPGIVGLDLWGETGEVLSGVQMYRTSDLVLIHQFVSGKGGQLGNSIGFSIEPTCERFFSRTSFLH